MVSALLVTDIFVLHFLRFAHFAPAGAQFRRTLHGVVGALGEAAAEYVAGILHDHEGKGIQFFDQLFDFGHLGQLDHAEQQFPVLVGVGPFPFDVGDAAPDDLDDGFGDFFVAVADDDNIFLEVKAVGEGVGHFKYDEVRGEGVEGRFQSEEERACRQQDDVDQEPRGADADAVEFLDDGADDIAAAGAAAHPVEGAQPDAVEHAAGDTAQHGVVDLCQLLQRREQLQEEGQDQGSVDAADEIVAAHELIGQEEQGDIENNVGDADLPAEQVEQDHAQAGDAAAQ